MITQANRTTTRAMLPTSFHEKWQELPADEFLYRYLLANTKLKAYDDGLPDEEQKVLKHYGIKYWEPGMEEVSFEGKKYAVISRKL